MINKKCPRLIDEVRKPSPECRRVSLFQSHCHEPGIKDFDLGRDLKLVVARGKEVVNVENSTRIKRQVRWTLYNSVFTSPPDLRRNSSFYLKSTFRLLTVLEEH